MSDITIDMDKRCAECGKPGAMGSGICLKCARQAITGKPMKSAQGKAALARYRTVVDEQEL